MRRFASAVALFLAACAPRPPVVKELRIPYCSDGAERVQLPGTDGTKATDWECRGGSLPTRSTENEPAPK